ncbi:hypothetical protein FA95DRAFT_1611932, partial [Auriscalpium vulgare]
MAAGSKDAPAKISAAARKRAASGPNAATASARQTRGSTTDARAQSPTPAARNGRPTRTRRPTAAAAAASAAAGPSRDLTPVLNQNALAGPSLPSMPLAPFGGLDFPGDENPYVRPAFPGEHLQFWHANDRSPSPATIEESMASITDAPWNPTLRPEESPLASPFLAQARGRQASGSVAEDEPGSAHSASLSPASASPFSDAENLPPAEPQPAGLAPEQPEFVPLPAAAPDTPQYVQPPSAAEKERTMARIRSAGPSFPQLEAAIDPPAFTSGAFPPIHFAHHAVAFEDTSRFQVDAWFDIATAKLVVRPFEPPARTPAEQAPVALQLTRLLTAITGLTTIEVSAPQRSQLAAEAGRYPKGYLAHGLTPDAVELVLAREVWSSRDLTFHAIPFAAFLPSLLFRLAGLTTRDPAIVRRLVRFTWTKSPIPEFFAALVDSTKHSKRPLTDAHIQHIISS